MWLRGRTPPSDDSRYSATMLRLLGGKCKRGIGLGIPARAGPGKPCRYGLIHQISQAPARDVVGPARRSLGGKSMRYPCLWPERYILPLSRTYSPPAEV